MKSIQILSLITIFALSLSSCKKEKEEIIESSTPLTTIKIESLHAPGDVMDQQTGEIIAESSFIYFDFSSGELVDEGADWDIAFKGTEIIVNGGINGNKGVTAALVINTFDEVKEAPEASAFATDTELAHAIPTGSDNGWYNYNPGNHVISPIPGRVLVFKTAEGKYAKMEILNFYNNAPANPDPMTDESGYYTFNFAFQSNGERQF